MLMDINESGKPLQAFVDRAKDKSDSFRLMGFGHRVYKNYDPRARLIREICHQLLNDMESSGEQKKLLETAMALEKVALEDDYFVQRNLYPNVDFYSGIIFLAMGIPMNMFTVIFAMARTVGWITQWIEMQTDANFKIGRPRQLYTGLIDLDYVPIDKRK
jgi:citrate synthase